MSTLGGSRGERNAKPKFSALDINRMYKNSRGETTEPSAQKNQVPRKHGMQSLGKVPSARRPPANLPSLKAETISSPLVANSIIITGQEDGTVGGGGSGGNPNTNRKSAVADHRDHYHHHQNHQQINSNHHNHYQRDSHGRHHYQQQRQDAHSYKDGNDVGGGGGSVSCGDEHTRDISEVSLRPQTDAAVWLQQQEKAAKGALIGENASNHQGQGPQQSTTSNANAAVPLPILALMPPFMQRGAPMTSGSISSTTSGVGRSQTPPSYQNGISKDTPTSSANVRPQPRGALNDYRSNSPAIASFRVSTNVPKRPNQLSTPPPANGSHDRERVNSVSGSGPNARKEKEFIIEPEVAQMQRPIIREEDLERLNAIANDDSWTKQDEIDYTKKLTFSDEESPEEQTPIQERERPIFNKNNNSGGNAVEQRKNSNASAASSSTGAGGIGNWQRKERDSSEREKSSSGLDQLEDSRHQNGHRPAGPPGSIPLDAGVLERAKLRREEEERRDMERKQAAARKKQELEMKMNCKKAAGDGLEQGVQSSGAGLGPGNDESQQARRMGSNNYERGPACGGGNRAYERDMRGGGDYIRGNNGSGSNSGSSVGAPGSSTGGAPKSIFSAHFQSNLPPRFQRQQQMQSQQSSTSVGGNANNSGVGRSMSGGQSLEKSASSTSTYENTRYMQKSSASQRMGSLSGGSSRGEYRDNYPRTYGRSRNDSEREDDQRYHGRAGRDDHQGRNMGCNQLARGVSDTSQRKTSVSSNDDSIKYGGDCKEYNSAAAVSSWAEETDAEMKRQRGESFSSSHSHESTHIKILQRPHTQKSLSEEDTTASQQPQPQQPQKQQPQQHRISESSDNQSVTFAPTQILRRSESNDDKSTHQNKPSAIGDNKLGDELPKVIAESSSGSEIVQENQLNASTVTEIQNKVHENEYVGQETANQRKEPCHNNKIEFGESNVGDTSKTDEQRTLSSQPQPQREQKRPSPRGGGSGGRVDRDRGDRGTHSRSFGGSGGSYRGGRDGGWNSRGSHSRGGGRYNNSSTNSDTHYLGDSEHPEEDECDEITYGNIRRSERNLKMSRKDSGGGGGRRNGGSSDERGFTPRGEPSRRGRGGGASVGDRGISSSSYRRSNDNRAGGRNYGRQNYSDHKDMSKRVSESSESNNTEIDKTKQNQLALNAGLSKALDKDCDQSRSSQSSNTSKQSPTLVATKTQDPEKKSCTTTPCKQFVIGNSGSGQSRKESTSSNKNDDDHNSGGGSERDKKSSSKEKDIPGSGLIVGTSRHIISNSNNTINSANNAASSITQPKKQDLPMTPLPIVNQGASKPIQQPQSPQLQTQQHPQHTVTKPPPGLSGSILKPAGSCASISSIGGNSQKSTTDLQKSKSDPNNSSSLSAQIKEVDKNKLGSVGSLSGDSKANSGGLIIDGAPVNTIIFENTNYKQQAQAAQMKRSSESLVSSSVVSGVNVSVSSADTISTAFSQMSFCSGKPAEINSPANVAANDYDKEIKLGFSFGDATESYTSATKGV
uniref:BAT2 N-terminal domain-containing protein n=1 Tax=Glossina palpalis gambiensis TaxID=67801 RepID=A0A1B0C0F0_9MUSC